MSSKGKSAAAGEQDQQGGLVPKLRFPEFRDAPAWELWPLKKLAKRRTRKNVGAKVDRVLTNSAEHGVVDQRDYFEKDIANPGNLEGYFIIEKGDYVYNPRVSNLAPVGPIHKNDVGLGVMSPLYTVFFFDSVKNDFYSHYFKTPHWHQYLRHVSNSGARHDRMAISADDFINMPVPVSNPPEQQKIADCLSSIDALIAAEAEKLEALKDHKKGLMQQLFPAPGETTPRLRFPEFQDAGEWEEKEVGDVFTVTRGNVLAMTLVDDVPTDRKPYPVYSSQTKRAGLAGYYSEFLYEDAITWTTDGANAGDVNYRAGKFYCTNVCGVLISREGYANPCVAAIINSVSKSHVSYVGNPKLMNGVMAKIVVPLPSVEEQAKITFLLTSVDTLIAEQDDKVATLKAHKNGLMQHLFPSQDKIDV
jgi:type I restriction enzyme S subunit